MSEINSPLAFEPICVKQYAFQGYRTESSIFDRERRPIDSAYEKAMFNPDMPTTAGMTYTSLAYRFFCILKNQNRRVQQQWIRLFCLIVYLFKFILCSLSL